MPLNYIRKIHILHPWLVDGSQPSHMDAVLQCHRARKDFMQSVVPKEQVSAQSGKKGKEEKKRAGVSYLTIPASTRSFSHHAFTTLRATTWRQDCHSSADGAEGREIRNAESTICGRAFGAVREER
jgi:hypothetical protein